MSDTEEINAEDQAEESLEAPAEENTEEPAQEEEVDPEEENEEAPVENETELVDAEDEGKGDGDVEEDLEGGGDAENEEGNDEEDQNEEEEYEDDFEPEDDNEEEAPADAASQSESPTRTNLSVNAMELIDSKVSQILQAFGVPEREESQTDETHDKEDSSSSSSSSDSETEQDAVDACDEDCSDGATDEHRLERLHTIIKQNDYRKFRWFTSLFLSDIVDLEELCQVPMNGLTGLTLLGVLGRTKMLKRLSELGVLLYHQDPDGQAAIHRAVRNGHVRTVNYLSTLGQSTYQDSDGMAPLHICAATKHVKVMEALADHCSDMDIPYGSSHLTPLMLACMNGCIEMVECLVKHGAKLDTSNSVGNTCLHLATANNQLDIVKKLLELEDGSGALNKQNGDGATALHTALQLQHLDVFDRLLEAGADPTIKEQHGMGAVHIAAVLGVEAAISLLEIHGADLNTQDDRGATPLLLAVSQGHKQIVKKLLSQGVDVNTADLEVVTPLHAVCREGDVSTAKQIVEAGAQIDRTSKQGMTPLCMAVAGGHTEVVKLLLDSNADPNMTGPLAGSGDPGVSPMLVACQGMKLPMVEMLLASGGSPFEPRVSSNHLPPVYIPIKRRYTSIMNKIINKYNDSPSLYKIIKCCTLEDAEFLRHTDFQRHRESQNGFGWTLLHHAAMEGNTVAADILLRLGCNPNLQDHDGNTPVHFACIHGHGQLLEVLTDSYNTNVNIPNKKGDTCMNLAIQSGKEEVVSFLLSCRSATGSDDNSQLLPLLVQAITAGKNAVAEMLFINGSSEIQRYNDWKQLLHMAVEHGSSKLVNLILEKGPIDVHSPVTDAEETCLHLAARSGNLETSMELIMRKSDVNKINALKRKPIHYAALEGHTGIVEVLLDCGAKVSLVDEDGAPDYYLCKHKSVWDLLKTWCKTHPGSVTTAPSPSAPPGDCVDGRRQSTRSARHSSGSVVGEIDGFQEVSAPTHVRLPAYTRRRSSPVAPGITSSSSGSPRHGSPGPSPVRRSPHQTPHRSSTGNQQPNQTSNIFDSFRSTLL